jgi:hypothetical protein
MAKKASGKKRKSSGGERTSERKLEREGQTLGTVSVPVQCEVYVGDNVGRFNELVIEWACLGLAEEPDVIKERSGNAVLLHPERPLVTSEEGLHVFFKDDLPHGTYGFQFLAVYFDSVEARTADPEKVKKLEEAREKHEEQEPTF